MKLNRNNYEEYFILYLDNELSAEDRLEVEVFARENLDLKAELDMLMLSKLSPDTDISFSNKESLMIRNSSSISMTNYEEWLVTYIDNELTEKERKDVESFVSNNPVLQKEFDVLQKTRLQPETIVFPYKESLYRKEEKVRIVGMRWWRLAAAAVLILGIGTTAIVLLNNESGGEKPGIVNGKPTIKTPAKNIDVKAPGNVPQQNQDALVNRDPQTTDPLNRQPSNTIAAKDKIPAKNKDIKSPDVKQQEPAIAKNDIIRKPDNNLPQPTKENPYVKEPDVKNNSIATNTPSDRTLTIPKETQGITDVTPGAINTLHEISSDTEDGMEQPTGKKNKLRGFFRKITRTFEKRTNIKTTDDDDRLLIAGLTIKLN